MAGASILALLLSFTVAGDTAAPADQHAPVAAPIEAQYKPRLPSMPRLPRIPKPVIPGYP